MILGHLEKGKWEQLWKDLFVFSYLLGVRLEIRLSGLDTPSSTMHPASEQDIFPSDRVLCIVPFLLAQFAQGHLTS